MNARFENNEGFRMLDEFVCEAIPDPSVLPAKGPGQMASHGENQGMLVLEELIVDATCGPAATELVNGATVRQDQNSGSEAQGIQFRCSRCDELLRASSNGAAKQVRCPKCGAVGELPG